MTASWSFNTADPSDVDIGITQRDQFNNEKVGLSDALVREVIQNSIDAKAGNEPVKVCFNIKELTEADDLALGMLQDNINPLIPDLESCKIKMPTDGTVRVLSVEDFNTRGLTGSVDRRNDNENFSSFWRLFGKSVKKGQSGGRWGLGKLVFSSASKIRLFFAITMREGDTGPNAMGQIVLDDHVVKGERRKSHGFWHNGRTEERIQLPTYNADDLHFLAHISDTQPRKENGLSIIIPYIQNDINESDIISCVLRNFYFPITTKLLEVEVGQNDDVTRINSATFLKVLKKSKLDIEEFPVSFLTEASQSIPDRDPLKVSKPLKSSGFSEKHFEKHQIEKLKKSYQEGGLVRVIVPVALQHTTDGDKDGFFHLFLQKAKVECSYSFFARGPILLTAESSKLSGQVYAGIVSESDDPVSEFLGDAETPSHTNLDHKAEKLVDRWGKSASSIVSAIRNSLKGLLKIVSEQEEITDSDALSNFFSIKAHRNRHKGKKQQHPADDGEDKSQNRSPPSAIGVVIAKNPEGFQLVSTKDAESWDLKETKKIRVSMAYDMVRGDPLRSYSRHDFDLNDPESTTVTSKGGKYHRESENQFNVLMFEVQASDFELSVKLHDLNRDLYVRAELIE